MSEASTNICYFDELISLNLMNYNIGINYQKNLDNYSVTSTDFISSLGNKDLENVEYFGYKNYAERFLTSDLSVSSIPLINNLCAEDAMCNFSPQLYTNTSSKYKLNTTNEIDYNIFKKRITQLMLNETFTSGEIPQSESYINSLIDKYGKEQVMKCIMDMYASNYDNPKILIGFLHILSHFPYQDVTPYAPIMALALLQHKSNSVREFAIKAFENWGSRDSLGMLKSIQCDQPWLQNYLEEVISDIEND